MKDLIKKLNYVKSLIILHSGPYGLEQYRLFYEKQYEIILKRIEKIHDETI